MRRTGQALTEFAVFGGVALLALTFLINIGVRMNYQQEIEQTTFRRALQEARNEWNTDNSMDEESHSVQYYQFRNRELLDAGQGFAVMPKTLTQANATVLWGKWKTFLSDDRDSQPKIVTEVDVSDKAETKLRGEKPYHASRVNSNFSPPKAYERRQVYYSSDILEGKPFIAGIKNELISGGVIRQDNAGSSQKAVTWTRHGITFNVDPKEIKDDFKRSIGSFLYSCNPLVLSHATNHLKQQCP